VRRENTSLVGPGCRWQRPANSARCEVSGTRDMEASVSANDGNYRRRCARSRAHGNGSGAGIEVSGSHRCAPVFAKTWTGHARILSGFAAAKSARLELIGASTDFSDLAMAEDWLAPANARLDLEKFVRRLTGRHAEVLMLRAAGYEWREIAEMYGTTVGAIRSSFWREIEKLK